MPQIRYEFVASGHGEVLDAIKSVERASNQAAARARAAATGRGAPGAGGGPGPGGSASRGYKPDPQMDAYWKASVKAAQDQGRAMAKEHARQYQERERHNAKVAAAATRAAAKEQATEERRVRAVERSAAKENAAREKRLKTMNREMETRYEKQSRARAKLEERAAAKKAHGAASAAAERDASSASSRSAVWELAGGMVAYKAASKLYDVVSSAAHESIKLQESTRRLSINARQAGQAFVDPSALRKDFQKAALETPGQTAQGIADALQSFVSLTGELEVGRQSAGTFATVASATGAEVGDVSQAAASIFNQFGLKTKEEMQDVLASLTFQGKTGAFELRDAASQFQRLAAAGSSFGLTGAKGVKTIGGLAQIARTGTGSAEQTTTAIENIFSNLIAKSAVLKGEGVDVFDKKGKTRDVTEVLIESIVKAGKGDFEKKGQILQKVFGDQGIRGVRPLMAKYQTAYQDVRNSGGTEAAATAAGMKRLREEIDKAVNAPGSWEEVQRDAAEAQKDASAQMAYQWERAKAIVADSVLPTFEKVGPKVMEALFGKGDDLGAALIAVQAFAEGAALAGEVLGEVVDSLYAIGIIKRKPKTAEEQKLDAEKKKAKAEEALAKFDKDTDGLYKAGSTLAGPQDPRMVAERARLAQGIVDAEAGVKSAENARWSKPHQASVDLTSGEFVRKYMELGQNGGDSSDWKGASAYDARVRKIAENIETKPDYQVEGSVVGGWSQMDSGDANEAQKALVREYQLQQIQAAARSPENAAAAAGDQAIAGAPQMDEVAAAAGRAAVALEKVASAGQPSIIAP